MRSSQKFLPLFLGLLLFLNNFIPGVFVLAETLEETIPQESVEIVQEVVEETIIEEEVIVEEEVKEVEEKEEEVETEVVTDEEETKIEVDEEVIVDEEVEEEEVVIEEEVIEVETWVVNGETATTTLPVTLGTKYVAPQDSNVSVTFTRLPEVSSSLTIERIFLTDEEVEKINAVSNIAFDITTDMVNGTFEYDLTLPNTNDENIRVGFVENRNDLKNGVEELKNVEKNEKIEIKGLDHFTVFVIIVDDGEGNFSHNGWNHHTQGYNGDCKWVSPNQTGKIATWTFTGEAGQYAILPSWVIWDTQATNAHYTSTNISGFDISGINQQQPANGSITRSVNGTWSGWLPTGTYDLEPGNSVSLAVVDGEASTNGNLAADALAFVSMKEIYVDDDWSSKIVGEDLGNDKFFGINAFSTIQEGIDAAVDGGIVKIAAGVYTEQISITDKDLELVGESKDNTFVHSPLSLEIKFVTSKNNKPVIYLNKTLTNISNLTVDGLKRGDGNYSMTGIAFHNAEGQVTNSNITNISQNPPNGAQHGIGVYVYNEDGTTREVTLNSLYVSSYQKNGVVFVGENLTGNILNSTITGFGAVDFIAQNGIQYSLGASGMASGNTIFGNYYTQDGWAATGILLYEAGNNVTISNNEIYENGWGGIYVSGGGRNLQILSNNIHNNLGDGIILIGSNLENAVLSGNSLIDNDYGLWISSSVPTNLTVFNNIFGNKILNAESSGAYFLDNGSIGNKWSDYAGFDLDGDGIGEDSHYIQNSSEDRYPLTDQLLAVSVSSIKTSKAFYKVGDSLQIKADITNTGSMNLDSSKEKLVINITNPSKSYISGSFREQVPLSLNAGEGTSINFYSTDQKIPNSWAEGMYRIHTSVYSSRAIPLGYLLGGQHSSTTFIVDKTKPSIEILEPEEDTYQKGIFHIHIKGADSLSGTGQFVANIRHDGQHIAPCVNESGEGVTEHTVICTIDTTKFSDGNGLYSIRANVKDRAGNISNTLTRDFIFDNTAPVSTFKPDISSSYHNSTIKISGESEDNFSTNSVDLYYRTSSPTGEWMHMEKLENTSRNNPYEWSFNWRPNQEGVYDIKASATDIAGNVENTAYMTNVTYDTTSPEITWGSGDSIVSGPVTLSASTNETMNNVQFRYRLQGETTWQTGLHDNTKGQNYEYTFNPTEDGIYEIRVQGRDLALNWNLARPDITIIVDRTQPNLTITSPSKDNHISGQFTIEGTASDATSGVKEIRVAFRDQNDEDRLVQFCWAEYDEAEDTYSLDVNDGDCDIPDGNYLIRVRVQDNAGNQIFRAVRGITVDNQAPISTITSPADGYATNETIQIAGYTEDAFSVDYVILSSAIYAEGECGTFSEFARETSLTTPYNWTHPWTPTEGAYCIKAQGVDLAGNVETTYIVKGVVYDTTKPVATFSIKNTTLNLTKEDSLSGIENTQVKVVGGNYVDYTPGMDLKTLVNNVPGTYIIIIKVVDRAGNEYLGTGSFTIQAPKADDSNGIIDNRGDQETIIIVPAPLEQQPLVAAAVPVVPAVLGAAVQPAQQQQRDEIPDGEQVLGATVGPDGEVLGAATECEEKVLLSGYVFVDKNKNGEMDEKEKGIKDINVKIYYISSEEEEFELETVKTNEDGYWEMELCEGRYKTKLVTRDIPEEYTFDGETESEFNLNEDGKSIMYALQATKPSFWRAILPWVLGIFLVGVPVVYLFGKKRGY